MICKSLVIVGEDDSMEKWPECETAGRGRGANMTQAAPVSRAVISAVSALTFILKFTSVSVS